MPAKLHIVATPIGNLGDISSRALSTLRDVDVVLCEDTRVTKKLLSHFDITTPTLSYHQHSSDTKVDHIIKRLRQGESAALVSDAGTPCISDPGGILVDAAHNAQIDVIAIPGPSAVVSALSVSGFPADKYSFLGFPPIKNKRNKYFTELGDYPHTVVLYESNHRIKKTLLDLKKVLKNDTMVCICRELTKKFESVYRGTIDDLLDQSIPEKGEFVIVIRK